MNITKELEAFDTLPEELRTVLNYTRDYIDPRYILGIYKNQGLSDTLDYLASIGATDG